MINYGLRHILVANEDNFTSNIGIRLRRVINRPLRCVLKLATKRKIHVVNEVKLDKNKAYIFASTHSFDEDIIATLAMIDRSSYVLIGTTEQILHNPQMYVAWLNGIIYVNRINKESRNNSILKMERVLHSGSSILLFPEGGWNNTENLLVQNLFAGTWILARDTHCEVVPISIFNEHDSNDIYFSMGAPLNLDNMEKQEALVTLRDTMATMLYEQIERFSTPLRRSKLAPDCRLQFMKARKKEYLRVRWMQDVWDEELTVRHVYDSPADVRSTLKNVHVTTNNAAILLGVQERIKEDEMMDFKKYMKATWDKRE